MKKYYIQNIARHDLLRAIKYKIICHVYYNGIDDVIDNVYKYCVDFVFVNTL